MARSSLLTAGFLLTWIAALPAHAAVTENQAMAPTPVATGGPTPLQEPHAVDQLPLPPVGQAVPAKPAQPSASHPPAAVKSSAKLGSARPPATAKAKLKVKPQAAQQEAARPKARPAPPQVAAKPAAPAVAAKPKTAPRKLAKSPSRHPTREARRSFGYHVPEERPHSGPVYDTPPSPALANSCDEACQYRDWLNRYAAWYRDFGRYYYGAPGHPVMPRHPAPPPAAYSENRPAPTPAYRPDQSERAGDRDRLDPWHGYNPHSPSNGY